MSKQDSLETIWEVPDDLWEEIEPLIRQLDPPKPTGRKRQDPRKMLNTIIFRMRSGCQWNKLPSNLGDDSTVHRTFQRWESAGVFRAPASGPPSSPAVKSWAEWTGSGSLPTPQWAKPVWGGCNRSQSDRPREAGNQAQHSRRCKCWPTEHSGGGSERPRCQAVGGDTGVSSG